MSQNPIKVISPARWCVKKYKGNPPQEGELPYEIVEGGDRLPTVRKVLDPLTGEYQPVKES